MLHLQQGETRLLVTSERWGRGHDQPNPYGSCSTYLLCAILLSSPNHGNGTIPYWKKGKDRLWRYLFFPPIFHLLFFFVISFFSIHSWIFRLNRWISKTHQHVKPGAPSWLSWNGSFVGSRLATEHFSLRPHTFVPWDPFRGGVWEGWKNTFFASLSSSSSSSSCQIHWLNPSQ